MQNFQEKLYKFEATPPANVWEKISAELDANEAVKRIHPFRKRSRIVYYGLTIAASLIIIFVSSLFFNKKKPAGGEANSLASQQQNVSIATGDDSMNSEVLASIIKQKDQPSTLESLQKKYITIKGPGGQSVKISSKAATLILSADNEYPPKPVWDKKINKWSEIMLSSTISPTATNLLDVVQISSLQTDN